MLRLAWTFLLVVFAGAGAAWSHDLTPADASGRYSFERVDDGFLRFDHQTGQVAFCGVRGGGWACQVAAEERLALENEIKRVLDENEELRKKASAPPLPPTASSAPAEKRTAPSTRLPSDDDLERAMAVLEKAWRRIVEMIVNLQKDVMRKG